MRRLAPCAFAVVVALSGCGRDVTEERLAPRPRLSCPRPGALPFDLGSAAFLHPEYADLDGPIADVAADSLGNLGGAVSSTDEPLSVAPAARNVHYVGRKARFAGVSEAAPAPIAGEPVSLLFFDPRASAWSWTGRAMTDEDGRYRFVDTVAERPSTEPVYAMLEGDGSCAAHYDALYPKGTPVVVTEIDRVLTIGTSETPRRGAARAMQAWSAKGYPIVYLTARAEDARAPTRAWLESERFPPGALVTGPADLELKRIWLDRMSGAFGWSFVAAYAASPTDVADYRAAGAGAARVFEIDGAEPEACVALVDFDEHREDFIDLEPDAP